MPIFRAADKLILYSHVPKCGGSAVSWYLKNRFGPVAFNDRNFTARPAAARWSRTSPQHIDRESLGLLFPEGFFDAVFTIVRHPVSRIVSAYHFQLEQEKSFSENFRFSDWLADLAEMRAEDPFVFDNHVRPMDEIVPEGAHVFHMEHGLDQLVPWFDTLTGERAGPRAVPRINEKGSSNGQRGEKVVPSEADLDLIGRIYQTDFERFGYRLGERAPLAKAPDLAPDILAERDQALQELQSPVRRLRRKINRTLGLKV